MNSEFAGQWRWSGPTGLGHIGIDAEPCAPSHPQALELLAHWQRKKPASGLPRWVDIAPREMIGLLPNLLLAAPTPKGWRYRLFGTELGRRCGVDWTGYLLDEVYEAATALACERLYLSVSRKLAPAHVRGRYLGLGIEHALIEALHFPVVGRDGQTIWVFGGVFFHEGLYTAPRSRGM